MVEDEPVGSHGISMAVATDPANQFMFEVPDNPSMDWAARALDAKQERYYKGKTGSRVGHLWPVRLKSPAPE